MKKSKVYGVCMVYNEVDMLSKLITNCLAQKFDGLIILDHFSNDGSENILNTSITSLDFVVLYTKERAFNKVKKINGLAAMAHARAWAGSSFEGVTWIVPMDADEQWRSSDGIPLGNKLRAVENESIGFYNHMRNFMLTPEGFTKYYLVPCDSRKQLRGEKCCFIYKQHRWVTSGFHNILERGEVGGEAKGQVRPTRAEWLVINHYPYRSLEQVIRKYRNLREAILLQEKRNPDHDKHSVERGGMSDEKILDFFYHSCFVKRPEQDGGLIKAKEES